MPFQAGFACTGQVAQGQTIQHVISYLHEGGFAAYVAASRVTSREGLFIVEPVTLDQLNKLLPPDLVSEMRKFELMSHNTLVTHGFCKGELLPLH